MKNKKNKILKFIAVLPVFTAVASVSCDKIHQDVISKPNNNLDSREMKAVKNMLKGGIDSASTTKYQFALSEIKLSQSSIDKVLQLNNIVLSPGLITQILGLENTQISVAKKMGSLKLEFTINILHKKTSTKETGNTEVEITNFSELPSDYSDRLNIADTILKGYVKHTYLSDEEFRDMGDDGTKEYAIEYGVASDWNTAEGAINELKIPIDHNVKQFMDDAKLTATAKKIKGEGKISLIVTPSKASGENGSGLSKTVEVAIKGKFTNRKYIFPGAAAIHQRKETVNINGNNIDIIVHQDMMIFDKERKLVIITNGLSNKISIWKTDGTIIKEVEVKNGDDAVSPIYSIIPRKSWDSTKDKEHMYDDEVWISGGTEKIVALDLNTDLVIEDSQVTSQFSTEPVQIFTDLEGGFYEYDVKNTKLQHYWVKTKTWLKDEIDLKVADNLWPIQILHEENNNKGFIVPSIQITPDGKTIKSKIYKFDKNFKIVTSDWLTPQINWEVSYVRKGDNNYYWVGGAQGQIMILSEDGKPIKTFLNGKAIINSRITAIQTDGSNINRVFITYENGFLANLDYDENQGLQVVKQTKISHSPIQIYKDFEGYYYILGGSPNATDNEKRNFWMKLDKKCEKVIFENKS